ncbi:MAG: GNAT family N-acetyltransferase [Alphaproteobacteria bacterium]
MQRANLLQSYGYARAICHLQKQHAKWGIIHINGQEAGIVQILEASAFKNLLHAVILDRGPLWFDGYGNNEHITAFFTAFNKQFPRRIGRKRRIIPETQLDIAPLGFNKTGAGYQTLWLDLRPDIDDLRNALKKNWRSALKQAENQDLTIIWDETGAHIGWCLSEYLKDRTAKGYDGAGVPLLKALLQHCDFTIGRVESHGKPIAGILILKHGSAATYQLGFSSNTGRALNAHHIVLWQAIERLKAQGITDFDLGGINDETAKGVKRFKMGLNGSVFANAGLYQ